MTAEDAAGEPLVGIVVVSHVAKLAEGVVEFATMQATDVRVIGVGGMLDERTGQPSLGTDADRIRAAILAADAGRGVVVLGDLASAFLSIDTALELLRAERPELADRVRVSNGPLVEGAFFAATQAGIGDDLETVLEVADAAGTLEKISR